MKINLVYTAQGHLVPESDEDYETKKHLRVGETYAADLNLKRNGKFHRRFFKMIAKAYQYMPEHLQQFFKSSEGLRAYALVAAGYTDVFFSPRLQEFVEIPKSIAYDKLDQAGMEELYTKVRTVLDSILTRYISQEVFEREFMPF